MDTAGIAGDGGVLTGETELEEQVLSNTTPSPWTQWAWGTLLCVILVASYAYTQGRFHYIVRRFVTAILYV